MPALRKGNFRKQSVQLEEEEETEVGTDRTSVKRGLRSVELTDSSANS